MNDFEHYIGKIAVIKGYLDFGELKIIDITANNSDGYYHIFIKALNDNRHHIMLITRLNAIKLKQVKYKLNKGY